MDEISKATGRVYKLFNYHGAPDATDIIIAMGSVCDTVKEVVDYLNEKENKKVGMINVHLYRPFSVKHLLEAIHATVKRIAVLGQNQGTGAPGEPLYLDVKAAFYGKKTLP